MTGKNSGASSFIKTYASAQDSLFVRKNHLYQIVISDAGNPHVRFDERGYGNVVRVEIETPTNGESRRQQLTPLPKTKRASPRLYTSYE